MSPTRSRVPQTNLGLSRSQHGHGDDCITSAAAPLNGRAPPSVLGRRSDAPLTGEKKGKRKKKRRKGKKKKRKKKNDDRWSTTAAAPHALPSIQLHPAPSIVAGPRQVTHVAIRTSPAAARPRFAAARPCSALVRPRHRRTASPASPPIWSAAACPSRPGAS